MKNNMFIRFVLASLELGTRLTFSAFGFALPGTMMHHFVLFRIDENGIGIQLLYILSMHINLTGFQYVIHLPGSFAKSKGAPKMEKLGSKK